MERDGQEALERLVELAEGDSSQSRLIAQFLLGLHSGKRFPFDLAAMRALDNEVFEDCLLVLRLNADAQGVGIHERLPGGASRLEQLIQDWNLVDAIRHQQMHRQSSLGPGKLPQLQDGDCVSAKLVRCAPGSRYRSISLSLDCEAPGNHQPTISVRLQVLLSASDSVTIMNHVRQVNTTASTAASLRAAQD